MKTLILGGARSGKSAHGEALATQSGKKVVYIATAGAGDQEMASRIKHHQQRRPKSWRTIEVETRLAQTLFENDRKDTVFIVDCLTLWLSNCLSQNCFETERQALLNKLPLLEADTILISNEVGSGIVPLGELSRNFVDESGRLHQQLAKICDRATLVVAGLTLPLKNN